MSYKIRVDCAKVEVSFFEGGLEVFNSDELSIFIERLKAAQVELNRASDMKLQLPEYVDWPGRGQANRQQPRGMSDYERGAGMAGSANYVTEDGAILRLRNGVRWQAQYKNYTTKWKATAEEAIQELENMNAK